jgi:CHAD domain-containing protein
MSFKLQTQETPIQSLRRVATEQCDKAIAEIDDAQMPSSSRVHQARKRFKKLRGLIRLLRPDHPKLYKRENTQMRDTARLLSGVRDAKVMIDTHDLLMDHFKDQVERRTFTALRRRLTTRRKHLVLDEVDLAERLAQARDVFAAVRTRVDDWGSDDDHFDDLLDGLKKVYKRGRKAMRDAVDDPTDEALHERRKRCKYLGYQVKLLRPIWPAVMRPLERQLSDLSDLLGDDHDLALLDELAPQLDAKIEPPTLAAYAALIQTRRLQLQRDAVRLGRRVWAEKPGRFTDRLETYHDAWLANPPDTMAM